MENDFLKLIKDAEDAAAEKIEAARKEAVEIEKDGERRAAELARKQQEEALARREEQLSAARYSVKKKYDNKKALLTVELDEKGKTLKITDRGIGMTAEEVDKYINQIAFSSAGEFLEKYKDQASGIIGHFGLGFYSAFMVSSKVTIESLSWKEGSKPVFWSCDGSPEFEMNECVRSERGTTVTLYLDGDSEPNGGAG